MTLGARVRQARREAGLSQEELAAKASVGLRTLQRLENDEFTPHRSTVFAIATALSTSPEALRGEDVA